MALSADARILKLQVASCDAVRALATMFPVGFTITCKVSSTKTALWSIGGRRSPATTVVYREGNSLVTTLAAIYDEWLEWNPSWRG